MADLTPDEHTVAEALWEADLGLGHGDCEQVALIAVVALDLPAREAAIRADERAKIAERLLAIADNFEDIGEPEWLDWHGPEDPPSSLLRVLAEHIARDHATATDG